MKNKSKLIIMLIIASTILLSGCTNKPTTVQENYKKTHYYTNGRYYIDGNVITADGNQWNYKTNLISEKEPYNSEPVYVVFSDNGTPEYIYDDIILGLVYDRNTAIYDVLETELNKSFEVNRIDNTIKIITQK